MRWSTTRRSGARWGSAARSSTEIASLWKGHWRPSWLARMLGSRLSNEESADHGHHRAGRELSGGAAPVERLRSPRDGSPLLERKLRAHRPSARANPAAPRRPAGPVLAGVAATRGHAGRGL